MGHVEVGPDVAQRPVDVGGEQVHQPRGRGGEPPQAQVRAQQDHRDMQAAEQVDQVVAEQAQLPVAVLQLLVEGRQLFVARLELFLGGLELLVEALQLLVAGEDLFIRRLQLFVGAALVLDDRLQVLLRRRQLLFQPHHLAVRLAPGQARRGRRCGLDGRLFRRLHEEDEESEPFGRAPLDRDGLDVHAVESIPVAERQALPADGQAGGAGLLDHLAQRGQQPLLHDPGQAEGRGARAVLHVGMRVAAELQDFQVLVHQDARRAVAGEEDPVGLPLHVAAAAGVAGGRAWPDAEDGSSQVGARAGSGDGVGHRGLRRKDPVLPVHRQEQVRGRDDGLRVPQQEEAAGIQGVVEVGDHLPLHAGLEVDEDVAAADEVQVGEGRIPDQIVAREDAQVAHGLADLEMAVHAGEEALQGPGRDIGGDVLQEDPGARLFHRAVAQVRAEDLDGRGGGEAVEGLQEADGDRIDLLARRASRHPDPDRLFRGAPREQPREHVPGQDLEGLRIAEERGDVDQQVLVQGLDLLGVALEVCGVILEPFDLEQRHAPPGAAQQSRLLVEVEVVARGGLHQREDRVEAAALGFERPCVRIARLAEIGAAGQARDFHGDALGRQDGVDAARRDGAARHGVIPGGQRVLREAEAAGGLDRLESQGAVGAGAGEDHADGIAGLDLRQRAEEEIDRHVLARGYRPRQELQVSVPDRHVHVGRDDVDVVGLDAHAVQRLGNRHRGRAGEEGRQDALVGRGQVLHEHKRRAGVRGQVLQQLPEGLEAAGGSADANDGKGILGGVAGRGGKGLRPAVAAFLPDRALRGRSLLGQHGRPCLSQLGPSATQGFECCLTMLSVGSVAEAGRSRGGARRDGRSPAPDGSYSFVLNPQAYGRVPD